MPHRGLTSKAPGKHEDNASKIIKPNNHNNRDSGRHHSTLPLPQNPRITSQSQWTLTGQEPKEGIGEEEDADSPKEMLLEQMTPEPKEGYRVCVSIVDNRDTSLVNVLPNRDASRLEWLNL